MSAEGALGKVHVITGSGKGKTTAAFGLAMRAAGHGMKVCIVQFMKTGETTGEVVSAMRLENVSVAQFGTGRFVNPEKITSEDKEIARKALAHAIGMLASKSCQMLVLDEVNVAIKYGLIPVAEVVELLESRGEGVEVVLTGRDAPPELLERADYVSVIESPKHPYKKGVASRKGVEY